MKTYIRGCVVLPLFFGIAACTGSSGSNSPSIARSADSVELAVIGDSPYQPEEIAEFPNLIASINADQLVTQVVHVGDIKAGATECLVEGYENVYDMFQTFEDPLVYSIGDNEWADCDRPSAGSFDPEERLARVREIFFATPGTSLGANTMQVDAQPNYPENQFWEQKRIAFGTLHVVGTNNNLSTGDGIASAAEQTRTGSTEYGRRTAANLEWMRSVFSRAIASDAAGLALFLHADMWKTHEQFDEETFGGFREILQELAVQAEAFARPVLIVSGDNHRYRVDEGVEWFSRYGLNPLSNVTQIIVQQGVEFFSNSSTIRLSWIRLVADASSNDVFQWEPVFQTYRVP